jgi:hypothetical protein
MTVLEARKRLLIAESEINRAQLGRQWRGMAGGVHIFAHQARTASSFALAATSLFSALFFYRRSKSAPAAEKPSWWRSLLKNAPLIASLWAAFKPRPKS